MLEYLPNAVLCEQLENVVAHENSARQALDAHLPMNVLRHVRDDAFLAVTELCCGLFRFAFAALFARFFQTESHSFRLSLRPRGA